MKAKFLAAALLILAACSPKTGWTEAEKAIIDADTPLRVLTIYDKADSIVLRTPCAVLSTDEIASEEFCRLADALIATVTDPSQDGVGIAAPQVGLSRRVIAVQRFDKEGEPFEVYPNVRITATRGEMLPGPEGCLSIPGWRGDVLRYRDVDVAYTSAKTLRDTAERVQGYSAIIFQHECDHLDGVLYIDKPVPGSLYQKPE
ncbi:MAG: peptide deformylase [Bacteroidales bacterium]|nr:peptide deformylase [Bacteroidales bacterium]